MEYGFVKAIKLNFEEFEDVVYAATCGKGCVILDADGWSFGVVIEEDIDAKEIETMIEEFLNIVIDKIVVDYSESNDEHTVAILVK